MEIGKLNLLEYFMAFAKDQTALSGRYARQADALGCIYGAKIDGEYAGYLCASDQGGSIMLTYAFTDPAFRNRGVFTELVKHAVRSHRTMIRIGIPSGHPCGGWIRQTALKIGFIQAMSVTVFSCSREDEDKWRAFMEQKGKKMCQALERMGYEAVSFRTLDEDLLEQLRYSDRSEFANPFHPAMYLDHPANKLSWDLSFAACKDKRLAAYCLVTMGDARSAMFDQISVSAADRGMGVILLPYVYSMECFFEMGLSNAYYAMYDNNRHAAAFRSRVLNIFPTTESTMENYVLYPE